MEESLVDCILVSVGFGSRLHILSQDVRAGDTFENRLVETSHFPPWPAAPDIIVEASSRLWTGVVWAVPKRAIPVAKTIAKVSNPSLVRFHDSAYQAPPFCQTEFFSELWDREQGLLELRWSECVVGEHVVASLAEDRWLYGQGSEAVVSLYGLPGCRRAVLGFGISEIHYVAAAFGLVLPAASQYLVGE